MMHMKHSGEEHGPPVVPVKFVLEDPEGLTSTEQSEWELMGGERENLLELAVEHGINIEHACGGVCACSTCLSMSAAILSTPAFGTPAAGPKA